MITGVAGMIPIGQHPGVISQVLGYHVFSKILCRIFGEQCSKVSFVTMMTFPKLIAHQAIHGV